MRFTQTLLGLLSLSSIALSTPVPSPHTVSLSKRYEGTPIGKDGSGGPDTSDYDNDDAIRAAYITPSGPSVFFSQIGDSTPAHDFASANGGVIFRGAFPKKFTNRNKRSKEWYQDFCDRFSGVYAEKAAGEVFVLAPFEDEIGSCRVWNRIELPTLQANTAVTKVTLVDYKDTSRTKTVFDRAAKFAIRSMADLAKRADACPDWTNDDDGMDPANDDDSDSDDDDTFD